MVEKKRDIYFDLMNKIKKIKKIKNKEKKEFEKRKCLKGLPWLEAPLYNLPFYKKSFEIIL